MFNTKEFNDKIGNASQDELRTILKSVFNEEFDYPNENLEGAVLGSIHMTENEGNRHYSEGIYKEIIEILTKKEVNQKIKKPTYKKLAEYLGVSEQAVKQYPKIKRDLMIQGLFRMMESKI